MGRPYIVNGYVNGNTFEFQLNKGNCHEIHTRKCSLEYDTNLIGHSYLENDVNYCKWLSRLIVEGRGRAVLIKHSCGHYEIIEGQHHICIAAKLNMPIQMIITDNTDICMCCYHNVGLNKIYHKDAYLKTL